MDKDRLVAALNKIQDGADAGGFHDELETLITIVVNARDEDIVAAWEDLRTDTE
jgi:hypothetical protein